MTKRRAQNIIYAECPEQGEWEETVKRAVRKAGGTVHLGRKIGIQWRTIHRWKQGGGLPLRDSFLKVMDFLREP